MTQRSKSTLFLIEQLIVIAVFAICAVACVSILSAAYFNTNDSNSTRHAILKAESSAEVFKATGGDFSVVANTMGGIVKQGDSGTAIIVVYYNSLWQNCEEEDASYVLTIEVDAMWNPYDFEFSTADLSVGKITGEELVAMEVAVLGS